MKKRKKKDTTKGIELPNKELIRTFTEKKKLQILGNRQNYRDERKVPHNKTTKLCN